MSLRRKILLGLLALLLLVPSTVLYVVATTEWGLQLIASRLRKAGPVTITAGNVTGTLVDGFSVDRLRIQHRLSDVTIEDASGRIKLLPLLLLQRVTLPEAKAAHVTVTMLRSPSRSNREPRFLPAALRIDADAVHVDSADVILQSGRIVPLRNIDGAATVYSKQIRVRSARADHELVHIDARGHVRAARPLGLDGEMEMSWAIEGQPDWLILAQFDGDLAKLPITGRVQKPFHATFEGAATTLNKGWNFAGHAKVQDLDLQPFGGGSALGIISGELDITSVANAFTARGRLTPPGLKAGAFGVDLRGSYSQKVVAIENAAVTHASSSARATARGNVRIVKGGPELDLAGEWNRFRWPLTSSVPAFSSSHGNYVLGGVKPWNVTLDGDVIAAGQAAIPIRLQGLLSNESLRIDEATFQALGGTAHVTGEARWKPAESWSIAGRMTDLDTTQLRPDLPGQVSFDFKASGAPFAADGSLDFAAERLAGKLRGQNVSGKGQVVRDAGSSDWQFSGVDARLGRTRLQLDGIYGVQSNLAFVVDADDLSLFDPDARGRINARGRYAGTREVPQLQFKGRGTDFEWKGSKLAALDADVDVDLGTNGHARGQVDLTGLAIGERTMQKASLQLTGSGQQQSLAMSVEAAPLRSTLTAQGGMRDGLWQGTLQSLVIQDSRDLRLSLEAPAALALNMKQQQLGQACLKGTEERLCVSGHRQPDGVWNATLSADSVPLRTLTAGLTQDIDYVGTISLEAELAGNGAALPVGSMRGQLQQAQLQHRLSNGRIESMSLGSGNVSANATSAGFAVQVGLDAGAAGSIKGELNGQRTAGPWQDFPINGALDASTEGLALLDIYFGGIDKATGRLITKVGISGTLGAPTLQGMLQLRNASIDIYQTNTLLRDLSLDANFNNESLDISGQASFGNGCRRPADDCMAKFKGKLAWKDRQPYGDLHIEGKSLRVVDVPEARVEASPDLDFKIAGHSVDVKGDVEIPYARLEPADLTKVVLKSSDETIVGAPAIDPDQRWVVVSEVRTVLGDDVRIDWLGLKAKLGGNITVRTDAFGNSRAQGELTILEGKYAAYGRLLDIERGRLIYNNVPPDDPGIDLRAQKVFSDITAGVNVRGTLRRRRLTFFSEPAIPQSQIQALLLGVNSQDIAQNSSSTGGARNDLLAQGLAQGGAILAQRFGPRLGIDEVGIESDLVTSDTSLVVGKYLSDRIYVSWGIGIAEAINTLKMRFTLGDRWTLKTEAGKARSADIVYTIRK
jgi:translocation and assembly module TamB